MFVLDTDHISILQARAGDDWRRLRKRLDEPLRANFYVSIISFHEQIGGWYAQLGGAAKRTDTQPQRCFKNRRGKWDAESAIITAIESEADDDNGDS